MVSSLKKNTIEKIHDSIRSLFSSLKPRCKAIATPFSEIGHAEMTQIFSESTQALSRTGSYCGSGSVRSGAAKRRCALRALIGGL